jgi:hypothetical protein
VGDSYTGSASCRECGNTHTSTQATQARADSIAQQLARTCASNDRQRRTYDEARRRKEADQPKKKKK